MNKIVIFLTAMLLMAGVAIAAEGDQARWETEYMTGSYGGCPKHVPGCPGYVAYKAEPVHQTGPVTITGNPRSQLGHWGRRDYTNRCYWEAGVGNVCMQGGKSMVYKPKRFRRREYLQDRFEGTLRRDLRDAQSKTVTISGTKGPTLASGNLGGRFVWRGAYAGLYNKYRG
ncbi:MAG: hypothetical protein ACE5FT_04355 [Candidatus Nanoarchaeia archaeon]